MQSELWVTLCQARFRPVFSENDWHPALLPVHCLGIVIDMTTPENTSHTHTHRLLLQLSAGTFVVGKNLPYSLCKAVIISNRGKQAVTIVTTTARDKLSASALNCAGLGSVLDVWSTVTVGKWAGLGYDSLELLAAL